MRIAIIGGGISGLATAFRVQQRRPDAQLTLIEVRDRLGGVIATTRRDGCIAEHGPDSIVRNKPAGLRLIHDLGLDDQLIDMQRDARRGLIARGRRLLAVPEGLYLMAPGRLGPFVCSPLLSWAGKVRMLADLFIPKRSAEAPEESLAQFVRRRLGREALERIAQPLIGGIYTADPERLSLRATLPQFLEAELTHGSLIRAMAARADAATAAGPRYGLFTTLRDGMATLVQELSKRLETVPRLHGRAATALTRVAGAWRVALSDGSALDADQVVVAMPAHAASRLLPSVDSHLATLLGEVPYASVAVLSVVLPLDQLNAVPAAAGFVVPAVEGRTALACTFVHRKYAGRTPDGLAHLRVFAGGALRAQDLLLSDDELRQRLFGDLRDLLGMRGEPLWSELHRWDRAMCQPLIGHLERTAAIRCRAATLPGLHLIGNGYEGVGIPDLCEQAERVAQAACAGV